MTSFVKFRSKAECFGSAKLRRPRLPDGASQDCVLGTRASSC